VTTVPGAKSHIRARGIVGWEKKRGMANHEVKMRNNSTFNGNVRLKPGGIWLEKPVKEINPER
jgi:hypothetical protein